ncbi:uncharacterized protein [Haliotis asinina]|uniref:uncharacterized protein isoform X2 n=1 Tax=Haliotis asinina TaxID=109174 RepID=UPI003531B7F6
MGYSTWIILCSSIMQSCLSMCPENVDRVAKCGNSGTIKYHCQYDADSDTTTTLCAPEVNCSAGTFASLNSMEKLVACTPCSPEMYQPSAKLSTAFTQPNCDYRKTPCEEGELLCADDSPSQNFMCTCDENQGWRPNPTEGCGCFVKVFSPCVCQHHQCRPSETLTSNFTCVPFSKPVLNSPTSGPSGATISAIILGVLLCIAILIIITLVILLTRGETNSMISSPGPEVEAGPSSAVVQFMNENKRGEQLFNRIKTVFIESVDPKSLLLRIDFGDFSDEKLNEYIEKNTREDGAAQLLRTVKRQFPDNWVERLTIALKHESIGLSHVAEEMENIRNRLSSETVELRKSGERVSAAENQTSEERPLLELASPGQKGKAVNV